MTEEIVNPNYFGIIPANVRYDKELGANAKLLYSELTCLANKEGFCFASNNYFAKLYDVDPSAISKRIKQLADRGYVHIEYDYEGKICVRRRIYINHEISRKTDDIANNAIGGIAQKTRGVLPKMQGGYCPDGKDNNTSINNININNTSTTSNEVAVKETENKKLETKKKNSKAILYDRVDTFTTNKDLRDILKKYLTFKLKTCRNFTLDQWDILLTDLARYGKGDEQKAIEKVKSSYAKGYQAIVYENEIVSEKDNNYSRKKQTMTENKSNIIGCMQTDEEREIVLQLLQQGGK